MNEQNETVEQAATEPAEESVTTQVENTEDSKPAMQPSTATNSTAVVAAAALLVAIAAGATAAYQWYGNEQQRKTAHESASLLNSRIKSVEAQQQGATEQLDKATQTITQRQDNVEKRIDQVNEKLGRSRNDWALSEVHYSLRQANLRLQLFRDTQTALVALQAADAQLGRLADPSLHDLRTIISKEIAALRAVQDIDVEGTSLSLAALSEQVEQLTVQVPGRGSVTTEAAAEPATVEAKDATPAEPAMSPTLSTDALREHAGAVWAELKTLVQVRRTDRKVVPLLTDQEAHLLRQNLRLKLEVARLALVQRDTKLFRQSLQEASQWLQANFTADQPAVVAITSGLAELAKLELSPPLPDISASLKKLDAVRAANIDSSNNTGQPAP